MTEIIVFGDEGPGWWPIRSLASLAARLLEGPLTVLPAPLRRSRVTQFQASACSRIPRSRQGAGTLCIARHPTEIANFACEHRFPRSGAFRAIWIIDSFWTERLPHRLFTPHFDLIGFTQGYDREIYAKRFGERAIHLCWGTDALGMGSARPDRDLDLLRVGRQPDGWEDDARTAEIAQRHGLSFHGHPPSFEVADPCLRHAALMRDWLARTKVVLAHTNLLGRAPDLHHGKEYYTGRWTDALACGASVAGRAPRSEPGLIDWPDALIDLPGRDAEAEMDRVAAAIAQWTPRQALRNHLGALKYLDWRWRIAVIARRLSLRTATLDREMVSLRRAIDAIEGSALPRR